MKYEIRHVTHTPIKIGKNDITITVSERSVASDRELKDPPLCTNLRPRFDL